MTRILRWSGVPLAGLAVWYGTLLLGIASVDLLDALCPPELVVSGACTASWYDPAFYSLTSFFSGLVAIGIVLVPALIAPAFRFHIAVLAFSTGAAFAVYFTILDHSLWAPFVAAALGGSFGLWLAFVWWKRRGIAA
jgi:hypothetical protein